MEDYCILNESDFMEVFKDLSIIRLFAANVLRISTTTDNASGQIAVDSARIVKYLDEAIFILKQNCYDYEKD